MASSEETINVCYQEAQATYAKWGVDTEMAIDKALATPISLHCWQTDDVRGFENLQNTVGGGTLATGNYPGRARNGDEARADLTQVLKLLPGTHRLNLHASYAETGGLKVDRDALTVDHFSRWIDWAKSQQVALDFNPTYFSHPKSDSGFTLSSPDASIRKFWIDHGQICRRIAQAFATKFNSPSVINHWIPDGLKDCAADRWSPRKRLIESLDAILQDNSVDRSLCIDAVEGKLFGLGSEDYTVGSNEFYYSYTQSRGIVPCLDMGHFHPTESVADKLSSLMLFHPKILMHTSRPVRWDSDHVVIFNDDLRAVFLELTRGQALDRAIIALDFFDASINRLSAYVIGTRATRQAILYALLDPSKKLQSYEVGGRVAHKLALMEHAKFLPFAAVWNKLCLQAEVHPGIDWLKDVEKYEHAVLSLR